MTLKLNAAILSSTVCISDLMNRVGICGKSSSLQPSPLLLLTDKEQTNMTAPWAQIQSNSILHLHKIWQNDQMKPTDGDICMISTFSCQPACLTCFPVFIKHSINWRVHLQWKLCCMPLTKAWCGCLPLMARSSESRCRPSTLQESFLRSQSSSSWPCGLKHWGNGLPNWSDNFWRNHNNIVEKITWWQW